MKRGSFALGLSACIVASACSSATGATACDGGVELGAGNCLVFEDGGALGSLRPPITAAVVDAVARIDRAMPTSGVVLRVRADPRGAIPELGMGGFAPSGSEVILSIDPDAPSLEEAIAVDLGPMIAHEMHHVRRWQTRGYGNTLLQAMISEGLADHFSVELYGIDPPMWATELDPVQVDAVIELARPVFHQAPYDHARWFFGTTSAVPRWAGYSVGFHLVARYLAEDSDRSASGLYDVDAHLFEP